MTQLIRWLLVMLALSAASPLTPAVAQAPAATKTAPAGFPANLRWELVPKWIQWVCRQGTDLLAAE